LNCILILSLIVPKTMIAIILLSVY
jgi:hypothetical protein